MLLHLHSPLLGIHTQHIVNFQQMVSICLVTRDASDCTAAFDPTKAVDHEMGRWFPHNAWTSKLIHLMDQTVHQLSSSGVERITSLLGPRRPHFANL